MSSRSELLNLINENFVEAIKVIQVKENLDPLIRDILFEYAGTPNPNIKQFRSRLCIAVSLTLKDEPKQIKDNNLDDKIYCAICDLNFKNQTSSFEYIYKKRTVSAFLIRGENESMIDDLKWCCNQLLKTSKLDIFDYIPIVYSKQSLNIDHTYLEENFKKEFKAEKLDNQRVVRRIEARLKTKSFVVIVKNVGIHCDVEDFYNSFFKFYDNILKYITIDEDNYLIFLFIDYTSKNYETVIENRFKWYKCDDMDVERHYAEAAQIAESCEFKVIDLTPIESLNADSILEWINRNKTIDEIDKKFREYIFDKSKINKFFDEGKSPYKIINKILSEMKIKLTDKPEWLKY